MVQIYQGTRRTEAIAPVTMHVQILDAKGVVMRDQSLPFTERMFINRRADCIITLPLTALPPGEVLAEAGGGIVARERRSQPTFRRSVSADPAPWPVGRSYRRLRAHGRSMRSSSEAPFFVRVASSFTCAGSTLVKLKHAFPCMRFWSDGEIVLASA